IRATSRRARICCSSPRTSSGSATMPPTSPRTSTSWCTARRCPARDPRATPARSPWSSRRRRRAGIATRAKPASEPGERRPMKPLILVVEDEAPLVTLLRYNLEGAGFEVAEAPDGEEALMSIAERRPDLILLDWMLPLVSGLEVCRQIRRKTDLRDIPIIMLTARGEEEDRIRGLDTGAGDYTTTPFSPSELLARVRAILRRTRPALSTETLRYDDLAMDIASHRVSRGGRQIHLGPTEYRLLRYLLEHPGRVFSREQLLDAVWGHDVYVEPRTVDVHIRRLRQALNGRNEQDLIRTVRAAGYALDSEAA